MPSYQQWWCLLQFDRPVQCPGDSILIGAKLDADIVDNSCRLAFHGSIKEILRSDGTGEWAHYFKAHEICYNQYMLCIHVYVFNV